MMADPLTPRPTLRRRMIISIAWMLIGLLTIAVGAIVAINSLHQDLGAAVQGYRQLKQLYDVGFLASKARESIAANPPQPQQAISALQAAQTALDERSDATSVEGPPNQWVNEMARAECRQHLAQCIHEVSHGLHGIPSLNLLFARLSKTAVDVQDSIARVQSAADRKRRVAEWSIVALGATVVISAIGVGLRQYRRVIDPMQKIGDGARAFARGAFESRINITGDAEFVSLAGDFNHMASELSELYRELEQKVENKTKELMQSERLAGVGYLAAGVAHEINNPLGIIAGYGERAIEQLERGLTESSLPKTQKALSVICEEAFRCKQIIDRLLSLARPASQDIKVVSVARVAQEIVATLSGLQGSSGRTVSISFDPQADLMVLADEGELKQVFLNLIINGIEAVDAQMGKVKVEVMRVNDSVKLLVTDNGVGMTRETLEHIFQPFYTEKRGQRHGTGLGLSVALSIVKNQGGRLTACSAGANLGSSFVVELPAAGAGAYVAG